MHVVLFINFGKFTVEKTEMEITEKDFQNDLTQVIKRWIFYLLTIFH